MSGTAVIIPYFQRKPGMLVDAIRSVLAQEGAGPVTIVVCDDGSPVPADMDLATLEADEREHVILVQQRNRGAGAARNAALDALPQGIEWIAYLDSDDRWEPQHLARSIAALREGYDLCFADALREPQTLTHFQAAKLDPANHQHIGTLPDLFRFTGDFMTLNLELSPVSISTVVVRFETLGDLRFREMVFEDLMYWFEIAQRPVRVAFDATLQVHYGHGGITLAESWKSQNVLRTIFLYHKIFMQVLRRFVLTKPQRRILIARIADNRRSFSITALALLRNHQTTAFRVMADFVALDARLCIALPIVVAADLAKRLRDRRSIAAT